MFLSIIIPIYNTPIHLLDQCIKSVNIQTEDEMEIILVDDGSKEELSKEIDRFKQISNRIIVIHQENRGEGGARNTGIEAAQGDYLMFVDSDDVIPLGWIQYAIDIAKKTKAQIISGVFELCSSLPDSENRSQCKYRTIFEDDIYKIQRDQFLEKTDIIEGIKYLDIGVCAKLISRELIGESRFKTSVVLSADQIFNNLILSKCKSYTITNHVSYYYIMNSESISHTYRQNAVDIMMKSLEDIIPYLIDNAEVRNAFYYHVLRDLRLSLQFSCFNFPQYNSLTTKIRKTRDAFNLPLVIEARKRINIHALKGVKPNILVRMIKRNRPMLYVLLNDINSMRKKL